MALHVFYHMYCSGAWKSIVKEHFLRILFTNVYSAAHRIHCFAICPIAMIEEVQQFVKSFGEKFHLENTTEAGTEWFCLKQIATLIQSEDRVLYLHSKGVTRIGQECYDHVQNWVDMLHYFLLSRHRECLACLDRCEVVGVNYWAIPSHFSGNFWYAQGGYIKSLNNVSQEVSAEQWVLHVDRFITIGCPHVSPISGKMYEQSMPVSSYIKGSLQFLYYRCIQFHPDPATFGKTIFVCPFTQETLPVHSIKVIGDCPSMEMAVSDNTQHSFFLRVNNLLRSHPHIKARIPEPPSTTNDIPSTPLGVFPVKMMETVAVFPQFSAVTPLHLQKLYNTTTGFLVTVNSGSVTVLYNVLFPDQIPYDWTADHFQEHDGFALAYVSGKLLYFS